MMRRYRWWWIVLPGLLPGLCLLPTGSSASAETGRLSPADSAAALGRQAETAWAEEGLVVSALTPEEARRTMPLPSDSDRSAVPPEPKAVLPSPRSGGELVDQLMAQEARQAAIETGTNQAVKHRVLERPQRLTQSWLSPPGG
jgi:hypothetical protein